MYRLKRYFKGVNREAHRIRWPIKRYLWNNVLIVIVVTLISALVIFLLDLAVTQMMKAFSEGWASSSSSSSSVALNVIGDMFRLLK